MIDARQARENSYDNVIIWCETKLQPEILIAMKNDRRTVSKLFFEHEVDAEKLEKTLRGLDYKVKVVNFTKQCGLSLKQGNVYNITIFW